MKISCEQKVRYLYFRDDYQHGHKMARGLCDLKLIGLIVESLIGVKLCIKSSYHAKYSHYNKTMHAILLALGPQKWPSTREA